ncbi:MAG: hypothetical protein DRG11_06670 [Epsilonproteobacteria bacterium]|nr:MAG: hypothetical protein DRG11_06670 [Campylobacterota bacterium]
MIIPTLDAALTSSQAGKYNKFWKTFKYFTKIKYAYPLHGTTINFDYWNSMDKAQQKAMLKAASEIEKIQWEAVRQVDEDSLSLLSKNGMKVANLSAKLQKELDVAAKDMLNQYLIDATEDIRNIFIKYQK